VDTRSEAADAADRGLVVGDIDAVDMVLDHVPFLDDTLRIGGTRRPDLAGYRHVTIFEDLLQFAVSIDFHA
jgi:hypothetical protein